MNTQAKANSLWSEIIIEELVRGGVTEFCIAPGGRSTALVVAANAHPKTSVFVHPDERGLSYYALGRAKARLKPVAIICTSGTAVANILPAVVEASQAREPLLVLSCDLPWEQSETGANQSIPQAAIFGDFTEWSFDFPAPQGEFSVEGLALKLDYAVHRAEKGVVHLNLRFRPPFVVDKGESIDGTELLGDQYSDWKKRNAPSRVYSEITRHASKPYLESFIECAKRSVRGIIVVGQLALDEDFAAILELATKWSWPILADTLSQLRCSEHADKAVVAAHATIYSGSSLLLENYKPDIVLHLGADIVLRLPEKPFKRSVHRYLASPTNGYFRVADTSQCKAPFLESGTSFECRPSIFCRDIIDHSAEVPASKLLEVFEKSERAAVDALHFEGESEYCTIEPLAVKRVLDGIPKKSALFIANSLSIREVDYLLSSSPRGIVLGSPHGVKGIDGTVAAACGFADALDRSLTAIIGDTAALYDINSFALARGASKGRLFIVLNNNGGQIFSYVSASNTEAFSKCFVHPHNLNFEGAAKQYEMEYFSPSSLDDLEQIYKRAVRDEAAAIIEIKSNREQLIAFQESLFSEVLQKVESALSEIEINS